MAESDPAAPTLSAPLAALTPQDHGAIILITTAIGLVFALISILIRFLVRLEFRHNFAYDDVLSSVSMIFAILQSSSVFVAVSKGFGKTIEDVSSQGIIEVQKALYASDVLYIITIWLTKCSVASLFLRLSPNRGHIITSYIILGGSTIAAIVSIFVICLRCDLHEPWSFMNGQCFSLLARWEAVAVLDVITELALFSTSVYMVKNLQLSLSKKIVVILAFGFRLPIIAPIVYHLYYLYLQLHSQDMTMTGVLTQSMLQIQISYAIIAATIPCLRPFMTALSTHYGAPASATANNSKYVRDYSLSAISEKSKLSSKKSRKNGGLDSRRELSSQGSRKSIVPKGRGDEGEADVEYGAGLHTPQLRWDGNEHQAKVERGDGHSMESHESKQMIIERHSEWAVKYERTEVSGSGPMALRNQDIGIARSA